MDLQTVRPATRRFGLDREEIGYAVRRIRRWGRKPGVSGDISPLTIGSRSAGCSAAWMSCRSISRNSASTLAVGPSSSATPIYRASWPRHHALYDARWTRDAWAFLPVSIRLGASGAASATNTLIGSLQVNVTFGADCTGKLRTAHRKPSVSLSSNALPGPYRKSNPNIVVVYPRELGAGRIVPNSLKRPRHSAHLCSRDKCVASVIIILHVREENMAAGVVRRKTTT